jgi:polyhydroxyalkanoate synthesis repressor PhaR
MQHLLLNTFLWDTFCNHMVLITAMNDESPSEKPKASAHGSITIKKYANRRLYNTATSCYVTLDYLSQLVKAGADFSVYDAKSGEDITRSVLTHIIVEEETKGNSMLPVSFLRHLISFYGDSLQVVVPQYLEQTMQSFAKNQKQMRSYLNGAFDGFLPFGPFDQMSKQQMAMFEQALRMFHPFGKDSVDENENENGADQPEAKAPSENGEALEKIEDLRSRLNSIQHQLDALKSSRESE